MRKFMKKLTGGLMSIIMVMSLLFNVQVLKVQAQEYDTFTLYYYYEGDVSESGLWMDIWNGSSLSYTENDTTDNVLSWGTQVQLKAVTGSEKWYSVELKVNSTTPAQGFDIYNGTDKIGDAYGINTWHNSVSYTDLHSKSYDAYAFVSTGTENNDSSVLIYPDGFTAAGLTLNESNNSTFTLYYYYEGDDSLYIDIWKHAGIEFGDGAKKSTAWGWNNPQAIMTAVEGSTNWYKTEFKILDSTNETEEGFTIYTVDENASKNTLAQYDNKWNNNMETYAGLITGGKNEYAIYDGTLYESLNKAKSVIDDSTVIRNAEITVDKVKDLTDDFMLGTDISAIHSIYQSGACCKDFDGNVLTEEKFFEFLKDNGVNWVRIRVWNNPYNSDNKGYGGGNNDLATATIMGKYASDAGLKVLIDFHYSDFWADPGKQKEPKAWTNDLGNIETLKNDIYDYTYNAVDELIEAGVNVCMVQVGNETNGSMCGIKGSDDWTGNLDVLFDAGCDAVHKAGQYNAKEILAAVHFTNPEKANLQKGYADKLAAYDGDEDGQAEGVSYDVFATSYYPYWHGSLDNLKNVLSTISTTYNKKVMVAETSYAWTLEDGDGHENTVRKGNNDSGDDLIYPFNVNGQAKWVRDVIDTVNQTPNGCGVFYWEAAWIPVQKYDAASEDAETVLSSNKEKWEKYGSGWASSYAKEYDPDDAGQWYGGSAIDNQAFFDFDGKVLPSLKVYNYIKTGALAEKVDVDYIEDSSATVIYDENVTANVKSALPSKVKVIMTDATSKEVDVTWSEEEISKATEIGKYEITGEIEDSDKKALCVLTIMPENLLVDYNYSFENGDEGWDIAGSGYGVTEEDPYEGSKGLHYWQETADTFTAKQTVTLKPGIYSLTAYAQGNAGDEGVLFAKVGEGEESTTQFQLSGWASSASKDSPNWKKPLIENITVKATTDFTFGVTMNYQDRGWGTIDNFYLFKTDDVAADIQAKAVDELIEAVGTVTVDKEDAINTARIAYDGASEEVKKLVSKVSVLTKAEEQLKTLKTDIDNVKKLISLIDEKPTIDSKGKVQDARKAYDALPIESKAKITGYEALTLAEDIIKKLEDEKAEIDKKAAEKIAAEEALKEAEKKAEEAKKAAEKKAEETKKAAESVGAAIEDDSSKSAYVITTAPAADGSSGTVSFSGTKDISDKIITIQNIVKDAYGVQYKVTKVADNALKDNKKITDVTLGINITEIGVNAFRNCTKLSNVIIQSDSLSLVDEGAFYGDKALTAIDFSECKLKVIDKKAFSGCKELKVIKINGNKLTKVGKNAFKNIKKNAKVTIYAKNKKTYNKVVKLIKKSGAKNVKYKYVKKK